MYHHQHIKMMSGIPMMEQLGRKQLQVQDLAVDIFKAM